MLLHEDKKCPDISVWCLNDYNQAFNTAGPPLLFPTHISKAIISYRVVSLVRPHKSTIKYCPWLAWFPQRECWTMSVWLTYSTSENQKLPYNIVMNLLSEQVILLHFHAHLIFSVQISLFLSIWPLGFSCLQTQIKTQENLILILIHQLNHYAPLHWTSQCFESERD